MKKSFFVSVLVVVFAVFAEGCGGSKDKSSDNIITGFSTDNVTWAISGNNVTATLCKTASLNLTLTYTAPKGATVTPASPVTHNFANGSLTVTVTAENGKENKYTITAQNNTTPCSE